ncbi:hypothetical protein TTHERM_00624770 (macronuclear) [Tetrahymena thermophila SB210]|uniref:Uncharacterized protein n=1 Tax=Tetrahymena thermophila (strain SB210) TaxID=312017 RepID=Q240Q5_TETTS|nr:hypothetical protein TTHERM_00624770 [Tetrahymena thermophila SB210]EAS02359.1 hypothetical protein TTHERM_00624770 [Tetrahymena thermophila SB210]|eukprot:XP_001022604.1 hypothetical protein TTHERM_00624770 [Tetrahymena thermophila SB210]
MFYFIVSINPCYLEKLQQQHISKKQQNEATSDKHIDQNNLQSYQAIDLQQGILSISNGKLTFEESEKSPKQLNIDQNE